MAFKSPDRVKEFTQTEGTGSLALLNAAAGFREFGEVLADGDTFVYALQHDELDEWEVGVGTYEVTGDLLLRTSVLLSSNAGNVVDLSPGNKTVAIVFAQIDPRLEKLDVRTELKAGEATIVFTQNQVHITTGGTAGALQLLESIQTAAGAMIAEWRALWSGTKVAAIWAAAGDDTTNKDEADLNFGVANGGVFALRMKLHQEGGLEIGSAGGNPGPGGVAAEFARVRRTGGGAADFVHLREDTDAAELVLRYDGANWEVRSTTGGGGQRLLEFIAGARVEFGRQVNYGATAALTDAANISWNLDVAQVAKVTLGGNRTLDNPTNMRDGGTYVLTVKQDATGSRTLGFGTAYKWPGGNAPVLSTAANAVDVLTFVSDGVNMYGVFQGDFK